MFLISILIIILIESNKDFWSDLLLTIFKFQKDYKISIFLFAFLYENDELIFYEANIFVKLGTTSKKKKSKKRDFVPLSVDPYPPTIKREVLIRDIFDFF